LPLGGRHGWCSDYNVYFAAWAISTASSPPRLRGSLSRRLKRGRVVETAITRKPYIDSGDRFTMIFAWVGARAWRRQCRRGLLRIRPASVRHAATDLRYAAENPQRSDRNNMSRYWHGYRLHSAPLGCQPSDPSAVKAQSPFALVTHRKPSIQPGRPIGRTAPMIVLSRSLVRSDYVRNLARHASLR